MEEIRRTSSIYWLSWGWNPYGPAYTLLFTKRHMLSRPDEGTRDHGESIDTDCASTNDHSSDEDYSLSGDE